MSIIKYPSLYGYWDHVVFNWEVSDEPSSVFVVDNLKRTVLRFSISTEKYFYKDADEMAEFEKLGFEFQKWEDQGLYRFLEDTQIIDFETILDFLNFCNKYIKGNTLTILNK